jgi:putative transposase
VVRRLVQMLDSFGIGGSANIAHMLARAGIKLGRETVRRYRKAPGPPRPVGQAAGAPRVLRAKHANHIWTADLTEIRGFLGLFAYKLVVVLDLFSQLPLAFGVFRKEPNAEQVVDVLDRAIRRHGRPGHFVSDQGSQFTAGVFREKLRAHSIGQRFGAIGQYGSIAVIERFWRALKDLLGVKVWPPLSAAHFESKVELALAYYSHLRPHQGLGGATPSEVSLGEKPAAQSAVRPPRKTQGSTTGEEPLPFEVVFLDPERRMPVLIPTPRPPDQGRSTARQACRPIGRKVGVCLRSQP